MGATIYWEPIKGTVLDVAWRSTFIDAMRKAFGDSPWLLTAEQVAILEGMAAMTNDAKPLRDLIDAIHQHGRIRVWPEW